MKKVTLMGAALGLLGMSASAFAQFSSGNLVVSVAKVPTGSLGATAARHILRELTTAGVATATPDVSIYALAAEVSGSNRRATISGSASSEGFISLSSDNKYLIFAGYDADIGATVTTSASATTNRVVGRYDYQQAPSATSLVTSTVITDAFSGGMIRSATSNNGSQFWASGSVSGIRYTDSSLAGTTTQVSSTSAVGNWRVTKIYNGQLYATSGSAGAVGPPVIPSALGLNTIGTGTPTTTGQTVTRIIDSTKNGAVTNSSPYDFVVESASVIYIADDSTGATSNGGLQKWVNADGGWTNPVTYIIPPPTGTGRVGLRGIAQESSSVFYATTGDTPTRLVKIVITGNTATDVVVTTLATAGTGEAFRDVEVIPSLNKTISGTIAFQAGMEACPLNQQLRVTLTPDVGTPINTTVTPAANGNYSVSAPAGNYTIKVKTANTLAASAPANTTGGNVSGVNFTLRGGDINDDNAIDISDLLALIGVYNQPATSLPAADINCDNTIGIGDLLILIGNYNQLGA